MRSSATPLTYDRALQAADRIPGAPKILTELDALLRDPNNELAVIAALLRQDTALTARIIRLANGVAYHRGEPVGDLAEALARVGFREVFQLIGLASLLQVADQPLRFYPDSPRRLRENSLFSALLMEILAPSVGIDPRLAYTTGLLRSLGRIALDLAAQRDQRVVPVPAIPADGLIAWELRLFGLTGYEAGAHVLRAWRFPADLFVAVRDQLLHELAVDPLPNAKLLHVALAAVDAAGLGLSGDAFYITQHAAQARADLGLGEARIADATTEAGRRFEEMKPALG